MTVKGPRGELKQTLHSLATVTVGDGEVVVGVQNAEDRLQRSLWGLSRTLVANMIIGVTEGFKKELELVGGGYRLQVSGQKVTLNVGFSHPV